MYFLDTERHIQNIFALQYIGPFKIFHFKAGVIHMCVHMLTLNLQSFDPPASASQMLELQVCVILPSYHVYFGRWTIHFSN